MSMEKQKVIEAALSGAGFVQDPKVEAKWTRPSRAEWVEDDRAMVMPYDQGEHYLTTMTLYLHDEEAVQLLSPLTDEERDALDRITRLCEISGIREAGVLRNLLSRLGGQVSSSSVPSPLEKRVAELEEALKPFTHPGDDLTGDFDDEEYVTLVRVGDVRSARAALKQTGGAPDDR